MCLAWINKNDWINTKNFFCPSHFSIHILIKPFTHSCSPYRLTDVQKNNPNDCPEKTLNGKIFLSFRSATGLNENFKNLLDTLDIIAIIITIICIPHNSDVSRYTCTNTCILHYICLCRDIRFTTYILFPSKIFYIIEWHRLTLGPAEIMK